MRMNWLNLWTGACGALLIGSEVLTVSFAGAWAFVGLAHIPATLALVLYAVSVFASLIVTVQVLRLAHYYEPFFATHPAAIDRGSAANGDEAPTNLPLAT